MISLDKSYRTKNGKEVRLYAIDGHGYWPVHGAISYPDGWYAFQWSVDGQGAYANHDLIEVVMIPEYWVVFEENGTCSYVTDVDPSSHLSDVEFAIHHPEQEKPL